MSEFLIIFLFFYLLFFNPQQPDIKYTYHIDPQWIQQSKSLRDLDCVKEYCEIIDPCIINPNLPVNKTLNEWQLCNGTFRSPTYEFIFK